LVHEEKIVWVGELRIIQNTPSCFVGLSGRFPPISSLMMITVIVSLPCRKAEESASIRMVAD
jgi:hypothetical protein